VSAWYCSAELLELFARFSQGFSQLRLAWFLNRKVLSNIAGILFYLIWWESCWKHYRVFNVQDNLGDRNEVFLSGSTAKPVIFSQFFVYRDEIEIRFQRWIIVNTYLLYGVINSG